MTKEQIIENLKNNQIDRVVQQVLFEGIPFLFKENANLYYIFRSEICAKLSIHPQNFTVVGSAKTGFSLKPSSSEFGHPFGIHSDVDIVLVSDQQFNQIWYKLLEFRNSFEFKLSGDTFKRFEEMQKILFYGIIRMDKLSNEFDYAKEWWEYFNELSIDERFGKRRIRGAIFKSWDHATFYYKHGLAKLGACI